MEIARVSPSAGWVAGVIGVHPWQLALFDERAQREMWDKDPAAMHSSSYNPTGKAEQVAGGYRLSGRWSFSSGCDYCRGVMLGAICGSRAAAELLGVLCGIESLLGSKKEFAKGPRRLDIDILLYCTETIDTPELQVPHPRMTQRRFVLAPLAELAPQLRHPSWDATAAELLAQTSDRSQVRKLTST